MNGSAPGAWQANLYRAATFVVIAGLWQLLAVVQGGLLIPSFTETVAALGELLTSAELWWALVISNQALVIGFAITVVAGIPLGLLMGRFRSAERFVDVYLDILVVVPMAALLPILLMAVGINLAARVILVVLFSIVMVIVNSRAGVRQVDPALIEMANSFGATESQIWRRVLLPAALPAVMTGVRIGLGRAITGMVIVELLMVSVGFGGLILEFRGFFQGGLLYATVIVVVVEALLLMSFARWLERRMTPWVPTARLT